MRISDWSSDVCSSDLESASTRLAVWKWTLDYVKDHPGGGGFDNYLQNKFTYVMQERVIDAAGSRMEKRMITDHGRAYHTAYFELLGELGYFGFVQIGRAPCRESVCQSV